jgi:DNA-binding GntR family transcriptional regulator
MEDIYSTLFERIIRTQYPPDTWLKEETLAEEFKVSRTPIRETLRQLEQDGLIELIPKRGARVFSFTADDIEEIFEIRKFLEPLAMDIAAPSLSINGLMEIRTIITDHSHAYNSMQQTEVDERFHKFFINASSKRRLIAMLHQLYRLIQHIRELGFRDEKIIKDATEEHLQIIDALCIRNVDKAKELLKTHLQNSKIRLISKLIKEG